MKIVVRVELVTDWGDVNTIEVGRINRPSQITRSPICRAVIGGRKATTA
jgi:hypothetical protein